MPYARLGVNVDHVATIRQARGTRYPDPVAAASAAELAGADQITIHLREDRRHIQDRDLEIMSQTVQTRLNLEMAATDEMVAIAARLRPDQVTLVPERREELTTEGGLDVIGHSARIRDIAAHLGELGVLVSVFVDPDLAQLDRTRSLEIPMVELHTGDYADSRGVEQERQLARLQSAARHGHGAGLVVAAGHGLDYKNVVPLARDPHIVEFNIGHSIVARAILVGFERAVREMIEAIRSAT